MTRAIHCHDGRLPTPWDADMRRAKIGAKAMTNPAILEALAAKMEEIWNDDLSFADQAAAVLELCGPRPLVWKTLGDGKGRYRLDSSISVAKHKYGHYFISLPCNSGSDYYWSGPANSGVKYYPTLEAAQAAAQAHADAAHWANTKIGGK